MENKKHKHGKGNVLGLVSFGALNLAHGLSHIVQAVQSTYLATSSFVEHAHEHAEHGKLEEIFHNPYMGFLWAGIGLGSIYMAYRDKKLHKKQDKYISDLEKENFGLKEKNSELEKELKDYSFVEN